MEHHIHHFALLVEFMLILVFKWAHNHKVLFLNQHLE
jgi:hypothetical protein